MDYVTFEKQCSNPFPTCLSACLNLIFHVYGYCQQKMYANVFNKLSFNQTFHLFGAHKGSDGSVHTFSN